MGENRPLLRPFPEVYGQAPSRNPSSSAYVAVHGRPPACGDAVVRTGTNQVLLYEKRL